MVGYEVLTACDAQSALHLLTQEDVDLASVMTTSEEVFWAMNSQLIFGCCPLNSR